MTLPLKVIVALGVAGGISAIVVPITAISRPEGSFTFSVKGQGKATLHCPKASGQFASPDIDWDKKLIKCKYESSGGDVPSIYGYGLSEKEFDCNLKNGMYDCVVLGPKKFSKFELDKESEDKPVLKVILA
ncbi:hypothetical protein MHLP_01815 [Candidatus Mycoplasma haematolamae str. Purdue]|uniref:Uncharacterized protein n=1 Tax=Mycoplasma haematolamae (strain Purdue) TaxID=1212765 RepID=I7BJD8_MYCHA|nr:hypothetical protein [Candidatus Mycoplasma haematolamae]AFO51943.1 hypothetical protein MHLP_01815 [Candidatus Mycoplasma haematolamae str. Purdue]